VSGDHTEAELNAATASGVRWVTLARLTTELLLLVSLVVLARLVPPAAFGHFAVAIIIQELAIGIPTEGVGSALVQRKDVTREHLQAGAFLAMMIALVLGGLTLVASWLIVDPVFGSATGNLVRLTTPIFVLAGAGAVPIALLRRRLDFRTLSILDIGGAFMRSAGSVALAALAGLDGPALVLGGLGAVAFSSGVAYAVAPAPLPRWRRQAMREIGSYGTPASLASICWVGFRNGDYAIVGARLGAIQAGLYWRAFQLAVEYQRKISTVMYQVAFPVLSRSADPDQMFALRGRMVRLLSVVLFPLIAGLAITAADVIPFVFGPEWTEAVLPTQVLCAAGAVTLLIDAVGTTLMATGRPQSLLMYGFAHFAVYMVAVLIVARWGIVGVASAAVAIHGLFLIVAYLMIQGWSLRNALSCLWRDVGAAVCGTAVVLGLGLPLRWALHRAGMPGSVNIAAVAVVATPAYLVTVRLAGAAAFRDLMMLLGRVLPRPAFLRRATPVPLPSSS
jgi:O-antigen/teichoic acid export membrane protein